MCSNVGEKYGEDEEESTWAKPRIFFSFSAKEDVCMPVNSFVKLEINTWSPPSHTAV